MREGKADLDLIIREGGGKRGRLGAAEKGRQDCMVNVQVGVHVMYA